jgi:hypothetical protein
VDSESDDDGDVDDTETNSVIRELGSGLVIGGGGGTSGGRGVGATYTALLMVAISAVASSFL